MSLTGHLKMGLGSPIGAFLRQTLPATNILTKEANAALRQAKTLIPACGQGTYPYAQVGMAMDYRARFNLAPCDPRTLVAWQGAQIVVGDITQDGPYTLEFVDAFFAALRQQLAELRPHERSLTTQEELRLAPFTLVLALFEEAMRSERYKQGPLFVPRPLPSVSALLALASPAVCADLAQLSQLFIARGLPQLPPPYTLNPTFGVASARVGGADADLIAGGCLVDFKCTITPQLDASWLRQLAGYALLDWEDHFGITSVGLWMSRQGILLRWPLDTFLAQLAGSPVEVVMLRQRFAECCRVAAQRGA